MAAKLGYKSLDADKLAEIVQKHKAAEDAQKTAEERLVEVSTKAEASSAENELLKSFIAKDAATRFASLSDEAKGFVTEFAGDDPIAQYKFMTSENFQKMTAKAPPRTQGGLSNAPDGGGEQNGNQSAFKAMQAEKDPHKRREMARALQDESGNALSAGFDAYFQSMKQG